MFNRLTQVKDQDYNNDTYYPDKREKGSVNDFCDELNRKRQAHEQPSIVPMQQPIILKQQLPVVVLANPLVENVVYQQL